jgi:hypothetical protein
MKVFAVTLSIMVAASMTTAANAASAKHAHHPHSHHAVAPTKASTTDWPGNPYMDSRPEQVGAFFRDALNPAGAR